MSSRPTKPSTSTGSTTNTGGYSGSQQISSPTLDTWYAANNPTERFYATGTQSGRGFFQQSGNLADWEYQYQQASRR
ncbi:hypothetical protein AK830_g883 [Neonectria ditissima]|uniref:Uncharacterized protein n=1 Tax=Neonectria ditissima TaxID=78410 RepID=A0A0P7BV80_9HYPO|nr:hypothetical protein AK830_g883 [Neonectria ditissima]